MTYDEFLIGLNAIYHYVPNSSKLFVSGENKHYNGLTFEDIVAMKIDSLRVMKSLKNLNLKVALELMVQGFYYWEIAKEMGLAVSTIKEYPEKIKRILEKVPTF